MCESRPTSRDKCNGEYVGKPLSVVSGKTGVVSAIEVEVNGEEVCDALVQLAERIVPLFPRELRVHLLFPKLCVYHR